MTRPVAPSPAGRIYLIAPTIAHAQNHLEEINRNHPDHPLPRIITPRNPELIHGIIIKADDIVYFCNGLRTGGRRFGYTRFWHAWTAVLDNSPHHNDAEWHSLD